LAARLVGADVVHNEITAQLLSAADVEPAVDTVFEIGGQDSKFIDARGGRLHDFEMNKICAAGTGSFLEEQADRLGVDIVGQFAELAFRGTNPIDLGSRCTVFMDSELGHAMAGGAAREDLCAGLAYAVARNYLEKVVGGRTIGRNVVFQGGTSANRAVVSAFEQLLRRPVKAHPQGRVSGAIGAALLAARSIDSNLGRDGFRNGPSSSFRGFDSCRGHGITSFECAACENRCRVNQVRVNGRVAHFGDVCERYTARHRRENTTSRGSGSRLFPELFAARHELFQRFVPATEVTGQSSRGRRVGLIRSSLMVEFLPFWTHLLQELDCHPVVAGPPKRGTHWGGGGLPSDVCHPIKLAHGQVHSLLEQDAADVVLLPSILELEERHGGDRAHTCLYVQQLPEMARLSFGDRVLTPQLGISSNPGLEREAIRQLARVLGKTVRRTRRAWRAALSHQLAFGVARRRLGQEALQALARGGPATDGGSRSAVVVLGKPYNLHEPTANLGLARHLERIGLPAIPMDLLPLDDEYLDASWYMLAWQFNRDQVRALQYAAARCDGTQLYPIHLSSYGCGPDAFTVKHLERAWAGRPRLFLEFDEHHGEAGLVTRLEAFADEIAEHRRQRPSRKGSLISPECRRNRDVPRGTRCLLPYTSAHVHVYAGALQRAGLRTRILERPDAETLRLGEEVSSGRECHPYAIIAGDLAKVVVQGNFDEGDRFFFPSTRLPCLLGQYGDGLRGVIESLGAKGITVFDQHPGEAMPMMGPLGMIHLYEGLTMIDYLIIAGEYYRPRLAAPEHLEQVLEGCYRLVERCVADGADGRTCFRECLRRLESLPRRPYASRPVIGVTGDLYTRVNEVGNADLFRWLDEMGCEVWPSPFFAASTDFELPQNARRWLGRGSAKVAVRTSAIASILGARSARLAACLNGVLRQRCVESSQRTLQRYAVRYVGANSNHLIRGLAAKMADFAARGAHGVVSAVGLGCMVGTAAASAIPAIRRDYDGIPIASISYGGAAGPAQLIQQETFVQQAMDRFERRRCASSPSAGH
jgi:predicted CoA-substrate-specific enzyme activase